MNHQKFSCLYVPRSDFLILYGEKQNVLRIFCLAFVATWQNLCCFLGRNARFVVCRSNRKDDSMGSIVTGPSGELLTFLAKKKNQQRNENQVMKVREWTTQKSFAWGGSSICVIQLHHVI